MLNLTDFLLSELLVLVLMLCVFFRYAHPSDPPPRHTSDVGQCIGALLFRLLHLRHRRRSAVGGATEEPLFHGRGFQNVGL